MHPLNIQLVLSLFFTSLLSVVYANQHAINAERARRGIPARAPPLAPRVAAARQKVLASMPAPIPVFSNGGFEDPNPSADWTIGSPALLMQDSSAAHSGNFFLQAPIQSIGSAILSRQLSNLDTTRTYTFTYWYSLTKASNDLSVSCSVYPTFGSAFIANAQSPVVSRARSDSLPWTTKRVSFKPSASEGPLNFMVLCDEATPAAVLKIDDISIE